MALSLVVSAMLAGTDPRSNITSAAAKGRATPSASSSAPEQSMVMSPNPQRPEINPQSSHFTGDNDVPDPTSPRLTSGGAAAHGPSASAAAANGASGIGRTNQSAGHPPSQTTASSIGTSNQNGTVAGGGAAMSNPENGRPESNSASTATPGHTSAAPWDSATWPSDRAAALQATDNGGVPDAYRDVVRDYFRR
jgi:hypothetical protein